MHEFEGLVRTTSVLAIACAALASTACKRGVTLDSADSGVAVDSADSAETGDSGEAGLPRYGWKEIVAQGHNCGLDADGRIWCPDEWGTTQGVRDSLQLPTESGLRALTIDSGEGCAIRASGEGVCFPASAAVGMPAGQLRDIEVGLGSVACAIDAIGDVRCWGGSVAVEQAHLTGPYDSLFQMPFAVCAQRSDGVVECPWFDESTYVQDGGCAGFTPPPVTPVSSVASHALSHQMCGLEGSGAIVCWGCGTGGPDLTGLFRRIVMNSNGGTWTVCGIPSTSSQDDWVCSPAVGNTGAVEFASVNVLKDASELSLHIAGGCAIFGDGREASCWPYY